MSSGQISCLFFTISYIFYIYQSFECIESRKSKIEDCTNARCCLFFSEMCLYSMIYDSRKLDMNEESRDVRPLHVIHVPEGRKWLFHKPSLFNDRISKAIAFCVFKDNKLQIFGYKTRYEGTRSFYFKRQFSGVLSHVLRSIPMRLLR